MQSWGWGCGVTGLVLVAENSPAGAGPGLSIPSLSFDKGGSATAQIPVSFLGLCAPLCRTGSLLAPCSSQVHGELPHTKLVGVLSKRCCLGEDCTIKKATGLNRNLPKVPLKTEAGQR